MRKAHIKPIVLAATAMSVVTTTPALAQDKAGGNDEMSEIIVTARRIQENLQDVPISISVYNQEQLTNRNIVNSTDLATYTPSLSVNSRFGPEKASFAIRGFSQDLNTLPTVGVYFADVIAPRLTSNITSGNGAGVGMMFDLENVQVLKGPQGTLFGRNTTGGDILIVPKKPTDKLEGYVEGTYGNYNARRIQAVLNVPLSDTFKVRAGIDRYARDGYLRNRSGIGPDDFNDVNYVSGRLSIVANLTPDLENYTIFTYARSHTHGSTGKIAYCDPTSTAPLAAVPVSLSPYKSIVQANCDQLAAETAAHFGYYDVENSDPNANLLQRTWQFINTTTWRTSDTLTIKNIASYGEARESYSFNIEGDNIAYPFVTTNPGPHKGQGNQWTLTEELQFQGHTGNDRLTWQAGGYMERSAPIGGQGGQEQYTQFLSPCTDVYAFKCTPAFGVNPQTFQIITIGNIGVARNVYYYRNYALYGQATYKLTDRLSITAGVRNTWDWQKEDADNVVVTPKLDGSGPASFRCSRAVTPANPDIRLVQGLYCTRSFVEKSHKPTWLIDLDYKPTPNIMVYAKYARGYRGGGINEANQLAETWNPEILDDYELGIKTSFHGARVSGRFDLDGFWNKFRDQQTSVFIPQCVAGPANPECTMPAFTGINGIQNVGKSRIRGIEAEGTLILFDDLRIDFGYAYLDAKVTGGSTPFCNVHAFECDKASFLTPGSVLPFAPKNRITVTGTYTLPLDESVGKVSIGATFTHTDKYYASHANDAAFAAGKIPYNASIAPATDLLNLNLNWRNVAGRPVDLSVFATNVTNQHYYVAPAGIIATAGAEYIFLGEPRMYGMRLKIHFGD